MKMLILKEPGLLELKDVAIPDPGRGEVLVRVQAATTCGTDLKAYRRGHPQIPMPGPFGHEYSGVVAATGEGSEFHVGDEVMGVHSAPCQSCYWCLAGQDNLCESIMETKVLGSFAEYLLVPQRIAKLNLRMKPEHLSFEIASLLEPLACVAQGILEMKRNHLLPCESALVIGPGAIGLMFVAALKHMGVRMVTLAGRNQSRLEIGARLGAVTTNYPSVSDGPRQGFDIVIECTGQAEVWERSVGFLRRGGTAMLFGGLPSGTRVSFDAARLHYDQINLLSPFHFGTEAVSLAALWLTEFDLSPLISGERTLEAAEATFNDLSEGIGVKYVFRP